VHRMLTVGFIFWLMLTIEGGFAQTAGLDAEFAKQLEIAKLAMSDGEYRDAIGAYKKAIKLKGDCYACFYSMASAYARARDQRGALEACDKAVAVATDDDARAAAHNLKGKILVGYAGEAKDLIAAENEFRAAVQLDSKVASYHLNLATTLIRQGKDEAAKPELQVCLAAQPDPTTEKQARLMLADPRRGRETFAPEFQVKTVSGDEVSLHQFAGRVLVMDFWATWCPPCRESVGELRDLTKKYPSDKLVLLSVSVDDDDRAWHEFIEKKHMDWLQYRDADGKLRRLFDIRGFPTYLVIDGHGIIRQRMTGLNPQETVVHRLRNNLEAMFQSRK
jgi:peroxiredoxin